MVGGGRHKKMRRNGSDKHSGTAVTFTLALHSDDDYGEEYVKAAAQGSASRTVPATAERLDSLAMVFLGGWSWSWRCSDGRRDNTG